MRVLYYQKTCPISTAYGFVKVAIYKCLLLFYDLHVISIYTCIHVYNNVFCVKYIMCTIMDS